MRKKSIYQPQMLTELDKHVEDVSNKDAIKCSYDLTKKCSPNCAACEIYGSFQKAMCKRTAEGFDIGALV